jgi:hypothetical protein
MFNQLLDQTLNLLVMQHQDDMVVVEVVQVDQVQDQHQEEQVDQVVVEQVQQEHRQVQQEQLTQVVVEEAQNFNPVV